MVRRVPALALMAGTLLAAAAGAAAAERPGSLEARIAALGPWENVQAMGVTPDTRIVTAGWAINTPVPGSNNFVRVYQAAGGLVPEFGTAGEVYLESPFREVAAIAIEPDGQILVGHTGDPARVRRLNPDGSPDASFGTGGFIDVDFGGEGLYTELSDLILDPSGRILIAGASYLSEGSPPPVEIRRYLPDGSPDHRFGDDGTTVIPVQTYTGVPALALQRDGRIVVAAASSDAPPMVGRLSADGRLDDGFGRSGIAPVALGRGSNRVRSAYGRDWRPLVLADGRIRIPTTYGRSNGTSRIGLVGLTADGQVERRFGQRGLALGPKQPFAEGGEWPRVATLDPHGGILVAGSIASGDDLSGEDATIVRRFRRNGGLDLSFGRRGLVRGTIPGSGALEQLLTMLDDDTVLLAEEATTPKYQSWHGGMLTALNAGYDRDEPEISVRSGCHWMRVRISDLSALDRLVLRVNGRVVRRTTRKRVRLHVRPRMRVTVTAVDAAGNTARAGTTVPRC